MNSIRKKLFTQIGMLVLILVLAIVLANSFLLSPFYVSIKKNELLEVATDIEVLDKFDDEAINDILLNESNIRFDVIILNNTKVNYVSNPQVLKLFYDMNVQPQNGKNRFRVTKTETVNDTTEFIYFHEIINKKNFIILEQNLSDSEQLIIVLPLEAIEANVTLINKFLFFIGGLIFCIAMFLAYFISKAFTRPILEMNDAAHSIMKNNFDVYCPVETNDEIGQLAETINEMAVSLNHSMSELQCKNEMQAKQMKEIERLANQRKVLLGNLSHDLKTPLALIQGYAEALAVMHENDNQKSIDYCDIIQDETQKMNAFIEKLLNAEQIESVNLLLHKAEFNIVSMIQAIIHNFEKQLLNNQITIKTSFDPCEFAYGDPILIERVMVNLIVNAIQHVNEANKIMITTTREENALNIKCFNTADHLEDSQLNQLWDSFYKIDPSRTRSDHGHGLGLSIVRGIMVAHQAPYGVNQLTDGLAFYIQLPIK